MPGADTGLGLVLRKDLSEIYAPIRKELLIVLPLIIFMVALSLWFVRLRVQPLVEDMARAHALKVLRGHASTLRCKTVRTVLSSMTA